MCITSTIFNALSPTERVALWHTFDHLDKVVLALEALTDTGAPFDRDDVAAWITDVDAKMAQCVAPSLDANSDDRTAPKE
jgi:hypothetical protein